MALVRVRRPEAVSHLRITWDQDKVGWVEAETVNNSIWHFSLVKVKPKVIM